ncbi:hypothetical protein PLESTB_001353500 [Pleodorina starrii]|uniref:Uncharacterized protein n=1 Tax=Pleodorina starrii TaxID=330485 RepID=A0A9W6BUE9_9CHLO|nr:hypothetical protein PLESTB_001353500 [Pleodorina starrii]
MVLRAAVVLLELSSQITASTRATLEPSIGASLILPIAWAEEASEISAVQALTFRGGVYRVQRVAATLHAVSYPAAAALTALAGMAAMVAAPPTPPPAPAPVAAASAAAFKLGAAPVPPARSPAGPVMKPNPAPPETAAAPAPSAVVTADGDVSAGAGVGTGLLAPFPAMPDTAVGRGG